MSTPSANTRPGRAPALAAAAALALLLGCAHGGGKAASGGGGGGGGAPPVVENPLKHLVTLSELPPDLADSSAPKVFEQMLCNRLFELNHKQVMCQDDLRLLLEHARQEAMLGGREPQLDQLLATLEAPRRVNVAAVKSAGTIVMTVLVQDEKGATLGRFEKPIRADGEDVVERAGETAVEILKVRQ